eukprot:g10080.t1
MSLAPIVSSPPGGDHHPHHQQTFSVLSPVESFPDHETQENQAEMATAPRALVVNEDDILSCSSLHSSRVTRIGSNGSIALAPPTAPAGSGSPTAQAAATMAPTRPTCRVVLDVLETSPGGAATSVHLGGAAAGGMPRNFDNDSNSKLLSPSILPSKVEEEASGGIETEDQRSLHGSTDRAGEAAVDGMIHPTRPNDQRGGNDDGSSSSSLVLPDPVTLSLSPGGCDIDTDSAELSPGASTKPRNSTTGAGGRPTIIRSPKGDAEPAHRSFVARIGSFPSFFPRKGSKASMWGASGREKSSKKWGMLYSGRSGKSVEDEDEALGLDDHASERARKHWRVLRAVFMSLGIFRVAGLNRLRAKELSAAEVRRGLRRNVTGGGQNIIPTMSFYAPKVTGDAEASTAQYETLCSQWARFSPAIVHRMLRQKLLEHNTTKQEFTCERFSTTLLFADISGFTRLSARLNAEQLKTHTNQYFTMLIDVVARYGGDIIKFCGDAVMIVWPSEHTAPRGVLQANAMQGAACALAMLSECGEYDVGKGEEAVALRLHCGMGSGEMYGYLVGADDRWEYLVAGDPLRQIGEAEPEATQGEVILSPEAWELASTDFVATKTPQAQYDGGVETSMKGLSTALRGFTQESARHAIQSNTVKYLAEIRFVTTIFINIYGLEEQLKRGGGYLLQQTMDLGVGSLLKFGGVLRQFVVDDKGCVMIGAFGLPQYSYEDNEVRAISASKEIILAFQGLQLAASIGITTGQVYCGFVGASKRCEYAMMGCSVNLSARLMASAPKNTIQVDFEVWKRSHNFFDFETLTPIKAKGYVNPVPVFRPLGQALKDDHNKRASDAGGPGSDLMVGMAAELEVLENSARRLQTAGVTRPVILLGQSGSGKTRVVRSAQLRHIWRDAANIDTPSHTEKTRENDLEQHDADAGNGAGGGTGGVNGGGGRGGGGGAVMAPVIMTVCRNVHANTPYCIWNSIMDKIFKLETKSSSRGPGETKSRVSFTNNNDRQQQPQQSENGDSYSVDSKEHGGGDWASRASRSAGKRSSMRDISSDFDDEDLASSARRQRASYRIEKSRREQASRRSVPRKPSAFMPERTVRDVERSVEKSELRRDSGSQSGNGMAQMQMLTADNLKGIASVEMEMEGMESNADPVKAVGEAADIVMWMRQFCPEMVPMAPLLQELMFTGFSETRITAAFPPDVRHRNLERLVVAVMRSAIDNEGRRLLLVIEDAQWMNQLSMKLLLKASNEQRTTPGASDTRALLSLAKAGLRIMIIISARPFEEYFETVPHDFTTFRQIGTTVEMSPLSPSDCLVLARHMVGEAVMAAHPDADLLPEGSDVILHEKSGGGNPLFVRNIAITLRDNLVTSGTVTPLADLPAGFFHALIVSRFDALEPPEQTVLKAGTVIGATFSKELLLHMLPNNSRYRMENLHGALLKLIEANFISRSVVGKTEHFSFVHNSVQETVYTMMLTDQKESLHEVCAQWHEEHNKGNASYQSVIMHHWMRSSNTPKKVECHLMAAKKAQEVFEHEAAIQHMLALLAIAFGKDMATATVISLEPFLEATQPSLNKQNQAALRPPPPPSQGVAPSANTATAASGTGVGNVDETGAGHAQAAVKDALPGASATPQAAAGPATSTKHAPAYGEKGHGLCAWFVDGMGSSGMSRRRRRLSSMVVPVAETLTGKEAEAAERLDAARTAARLGCSVGNLTKRQREMLVAKDQEWLWAADFLPCLEFSDPMFSPAMVGRWIGWIGMAHLHLGRLLPAHNHMQEALVYLGFPAVPAQALPFDRALCLIKEVFLARGTARDAEDAIFAASLYGSIADISIKAGMGGNLAFINRLVRCSTHSIDFMDYTHEGVRLIVNLAHEELANGHHDKVEAYLDRALALSIDIGDPITRGIALTESGTYNAGEGLVAAAEEDFAEAFEMFAPTSLHGAALVHAIALNTAEASACLAQMRTIVEEDWARRRGRRGRTAAAAEGTSHTSLVVMETLDAYLAAARGDGKAALKCVRRASLRLSRPGALRFSSGLFLHLATDACFTILEQDMLPPGAEAHRKVLAAARLLIRTLGKFAQVFDLMSPLHQLGRARWSLLNGMDKVAEKALDLGLVISEEDVSFPFAEGLLLLHSTRIEAFPMEERRARARRGRRILHRIGACLIPPADRHCKQKEAGGRADGGAPSAAPVLE